MVHTRVVHCQSMYRHHVYGWIARPYRRAACAKLQDAPRWQGVARGWVSSVSKYIRLLRHMTDGIANYEESIPDGYDAEP